MIMREKEKMLKGELYDANDEDLVQARLRCKDLCFELNHLRPSLIEEQKGIIQKLFAKTGTSFYITTPFWCDYGSQIEIGEDFYCNHNCVILDCAPVVFGNHVYIGPNCGFYTAYHPFDVHTRRKGLEYASKIMIGNDVWLGGDVKVMPGVTIGNDVIIGAGSVVTHDIEDHVIAVGNPCRVLRKINKQDHVCRDEKKKRSS